MSHVAAPYPNRGTRMLYCGLLGAMLVLATLLKLWLWADAYGFEQGDPLEYINIAHAIAFRSGEEWWDIRPLMFSIVLIPVLWAGSLIPDPTGELTVKAIRLVPLLLSLASMVVVAEIGRGLSDWRTGVMAAALLGTNAVTNQLSVAPFAEVPSTLCVLLATWLLIRPPSERLDVLAGLALGVGCLIRYQSLAYLAPFGVWVLWSRRPRGALWFGAGLIICLVIQAALDGLAYGRPFHSLIESAKYNVTTDEAAQFYGAEPPWWFLSNLQVWLGIIPAAFAVLGFAHGLHGERRRDWILVLAATVTMLIWLSALSHKELRFASQIVPLVCLAAAHGILVASNLAGRWAPAVGVLAVGLSFVPAVRASMDLNVVFNTGFVDGPKRVALERPGATLASIPWFIARPYTYGRVDLVRGDVDRWKNRELIMETFNRADYILLREYDFASDREIARLVDREFRTIESYPDQVVLLQSRRLTDNRQRR